MKVSGSPMYCRRRYITSSFLDKPIQSWVGGPGSLTLGDEMVYTPRRAFHTLHSASSSINIVMVRSRESRVKINICYNVQPEYEAWRVTVWSQYIRHRPLVSARLKGIRRVSVGSIQDVTGWRRRVPVRRGTLRNTTPAPSRVLQWLDPISRLDPPLSRVNCPLGPSHFFCEWIKTSVFF